MMSVRSAGRTAIDSWLRVARIPFDAATHVVPVNRGRANAAALAIDRADAAVRAAVGGLLNDAELVADGERRRTVAEERRKAIALRLEAEQLQRDADAQLSRELNAAARLRDEGEHEAQARIAETNTDRAQLQRQAREQADAQMGAVEAAQQEQREAETKQAKRARLALLEEQTTALDQEAGALTAQDEAERLRDAANVAKSTRKRAN